MNPNVGCNGYDDSIQPRITYRKMCSTYADLFVFVDQRGEEPFWIVNATVMLIDPGGRLSDFPAFYHNHAASFTFADGHSEAHRWRDPRTTPAWGTAFGGAPTPSNQDLVWLDPRISPYKAGYGPH